MFKLEFETDNSAFHTGEYGGYDARPEVTRILKAVIEAVNRNDISGRLVDCNGNVIGHWSLGR